MDEKLNKELIFYKELNLRWTFKDMFLFNELGFLVNDINDKDNIEALVAIVFCGLEQKEFNRAVDIVVGWLKYFDNTDRLRGLIKLSLRDIHKFIIINNKEEMVKSVFDTPEVDDENKCREELVYDERQKLLELLYVFYDVGYKPEEALEKDLKYFEFMKGYNTNSREKRMNDNLRIAHDEGVLVGIAVNNPIEYPKTLEPIRLTPKTKFDQLREEDEGFDNLYGRFKE